MNQGKKVFISIIIILLLVVSSLALGVKAQSIVTTGAEPSTQHNITLNQGYNHFGIIIGDVSSRRIDVNVSLDGSINLIGFSALNITNHSAVEYNNNTAISTWLDFAQNNSVQLPIAVLNNSQLDNRYDYYPYHQNYLSESVAGWYRINILGNLTFKNIAGNYINESYAWNNITFYNSSGSFLNITDAHSIGWVGISGQTKDQLISNWNAQDNGFDFVLTSQSLFAWTGYRIYANQNNITLVVST